MQTHFFNTRNAYTRIVLGGLVALGLGLAIPTCAQQQQLGAPPQLQSSDVSDAELKNFVSAFEAVETIRLELNEKLKTVQDPAVATQFQREANAEMLQAVRSNDLEAVEYNAISQAIPSDDQLAARFQKLRQEQADR